MVFPIPTHRQSRQRIVNTLIMADINLYVRNNLDDKSMLFTHFFIL